LREKSEVLALPDRKLSPQVLVKKFSKSGLKEGKPLNGKKNAFDGRGQPGREPPFCRALKKKGLRARFLTARGKKGEGLTRVHSQGESDRVRRGEGSWNLSFEVGRGGKGVEEQ